MREQRDAQGLGGLVASALAPQLVAAGAQVGLPRDFEGDLVNDGGLEAGVQGGVEGEGPQAPDGRFGCLFRGGVWWHRV